MEVTKTQAQALTKEIKEAVDAILAKHGLASSKASTNYGDYYKFTVEATAVRTDDNGINLASKEAQAYEKYHNLYDLPSGLLGKEIVVNHKKIVFVGIAASRKKYPYAFRKEDGEIVLHTEAIVPYLKGEK